MAHTLNLPELPESLRWNVRLNWDGHIEVRLLVALSPLPHQKVADALDEATAFLVIGDDRLEAESLAKHAWRNYLSVHGEAVRS